jgi:hypothetical protein
MQSENWEEEDSATQNKKTSRGSKRNHWLPEEDQAIISLVNEFGTKQWKTIEKMVKQRHGLKRRSAKQ